MKFYLFVMSLSVLLACTKKMDETMIIVPKTNELQELTYLALGDSYTIGEGVSASESFPYHVVSHLKSQGLNFAKPKIIAKTGWTTDELQTAIKTENIAANFDLVTLLIGVNNQYRGYAKDTYSKEFKELLKTAVAFAGGDQRRVFVISIPDWGVTPFGIASGKNTKTIADDIDAFNAINKAETLALGANYTDITPATRKAAADKSLVASDGLHYAGKAHAEWALALGQTYRNVSR